jgi:asparagine synthetase B (glutamine-hydrolysing)
VPLRAERASCTVLFDGRLHSSVHGGSANSAETVLDGYLRDGEAALRRLDGRFTLVVWDGRNETLLALRDPLGTQPLFYSNIDGELRVSPTVGSLLRANEPNALAIAAHIVGTPRPIEETFFNGISRLAPGHILQARLGTVQVQRYWEPVWEATAPAKETADKLEELLRDAVGRSLEPGPVSVFLSGGLDSALVAAIARDVCREQGRRAPLMLSILFTGTAADEEPTQRAVAEGLGLEQLTMTIDEAVEGGLILRAALELAGVASAPPTLLTPVYDALAVAARSRGFMAELNGAGGDELLMPPPAYAGELFRSLDFAGLAQVARTWLGYWPWATPRSVAHSLLVTWGIRPLAVAVAAESLSRVAPQRLDGLRAARVAAAIPGWLAPDRELRGHLTDHLVANASSWRTVAELVRSADSLLEDVSLSEMHEDLYDRRRRLGFDSFAPLLDPAIVAFLSNVPPRRLIANHEAKALARELLAARLPSLAHSWPRTVYADSLWKRAFDREGATAWAALGGTPRLAEAGIVDQPLLRSRIGSGQASRREIGQVCRALILERWLESRIIPRSSRS